MIEQCWFGWCRVNHSLWVKLLTRWRSRVWALSRNYNGDCDDQDEDYDDKEYDDDDDEENRSPPICGHPFFPAHPTPSRELVVLINLIQFPTKWVTSALPLLRPHRSDTISDVLPFSTRTCTALILPCVVMHGILVILPPADAIYLIITIHKSHPQSQHPPQGTHTHRKV